MTYPIAIRQRTALKILLAFTLATSVFCESAARADGVLCALGAGTAEYVPLADQPASASATRETKRLFSSVCPKDCGQLGIFKNQTAPNVLTTAVGPHMSKIAYNPRFIDAAVKSYGPGASLGILAHEVGHHVDSIFPAPPWMNADWGTELRADAWAGCALAKTGSKPGELRAALQGIALSPSVTHPAWSVRSEALQAGFKGCGGKALAILEAKATAGSARGCAEDAECKAGRVCIDGRCQEKAARQSLCSKDVDCPGTDICGAGGVCQNPKAPGSTSTTASERVASKGQAGCRDRCGDDQESCSGHTDVSLRACKAALVADPRYKECGCPRWPTGRLDCYQFCKDTYEKARRCEASHEADGTACLSVAARCASDCP